MQMRKKEKSSRKVKRLAAAGLTFFSFLFSLSLDPHRSLSIPLFRATRSLLRSNAIALLDYRTVQSFAVFSLQPLLLPPPRRLDQPPPFLVLLPDPATDEKLLLPDRYRGLELIDGPGDRLSSFCVLEKNAREKRGEREKKKREREGGTKKNF